MFEKHYIFSRKSRTLTFEIFFFYGISLCSGACSIPYAGTVHPLHCTPSGPENRAADALDNLGQRWLSGGSENASVLSCPC